MKKKVKIKKNEIIRPLDSPMLLITFLITIDAILLNYCLINDKFVDDLFNDIAGIVITSIVTLAALVLIIYYYSWKVIAYKDRMIKYNIFNRKKVYYYKDLTVKENEEKIHYSFYKNKKRVLKLRVVENGEKLIYNYYCFIKENNKKNS